MARPRASARQHRRRSLKMVVTGAYGAGKTTLISSISEIPVLSTERAVSAGEPGTSGDGAAPGAGGKGATTVAMDFGRLSIGEDLALHLFGTPGQRRFDFMWEILADGMLGFVVMVDGTSEESVAATAEILEFFAAGTVPYIVAVNKVEVGQDGAVEQVRSRLGLPEQVRVLACDARDRESVKEVLVELLRTVLDGLETAVPANA